MNNISKMSSITTIKVITIVLTIIVFSVVFFAFIDSQSAEARVTQAHIERLRENRRDIQNRMQKVQEQIDALEYDMLSEIAKKNVLEDRIILTGFEIENIVATIEEYAILIEDKEFQITVALENENAQMQLYRERVRSMEEGGVITYLEIIFDSTSFSDLLARIDFVNDIMRADERIYNNLVNARLETIAAREALELAKEEMEIEYLLLESKEAELFEQVEELDAIIAQLDEDLTTASALHRQLSDEDVRIQNTINARVAELRRQQERDARAAASNTWGTGSGTATPPSGSGSGAQQGSSGDENLRWLAFIIHLEARGECLQGRIAIGNVIMNRVRSPLFPSTIRGVILDGNQFPPAHRNSIDSITPTAGSLDAARRVLNGEVADGIGNSLYFNRAGANTWASNNRPFVIRIGNHDFFR